MIPIRGDFATYKNVPSRKVLQLVIEVPAEQAGEVFAALGFPVSGESNPVAVAPLGGLSEVAIEPDAKPASAPPSKAENRPSKRTWGEMKASEQAGVLCNDPEFRAFLQAKHPSRWEAASFGYGGSPADQAAQVIRTYLDIGSRSELDGNEEACGLWNSVVNRFRDWQSARHETQRYGEMAG